MLAYNPRPAYQNDDPDRMFGTRLFDLEVRWNQAGTSITVQEIVPITQGAEDHRP